MEYPFTKIEHCIYKNTFLQNTLLNFHFDNILKDRKEDDIKKDFRKFVEKRFGLNIDDSKEQSLSLGIRIVSSDQSTMLTFQSDRCLIRVGREQYKSFEQSILPLIDVVKDYITNVAKKQILESFSIRKINVWPIQTFKDVTLADILLKKIFSSELLSDDSFNAQLPENRGVTNWQKEKQFCIDDAILKLKYGFNCKDDRNILIILDTVIETTTSSELDKINFTHYDEIMFDSYHWAVNSDIVNLMQKDLND